MDLFYYHLYLFYRVIIKLNVKCNDIVCLSFSLSSYWCADMHQHIDIFDQTLCSVHRNPPRFQTSTPMRKHGPTTCLAWTPAGVLTPQLLPCSHGRKAAIVRPIPAQKVSLRSEIQNMLTTSILSICYLAIIAHLQYTHIYMSRKSTKVI